MKTENPLIAFRLLFAISILFYITASCTSDNPIIYFEKKIPTGNTISKKIDDYGHVVEYAYNEDKLIKSKNFTYEKFKDTTVNAYIDFTEFLYDGKILKSMTHKMYRKSTNSNGVSLDSSNSTTTYIYEGENIAEVHSVSTTISKSPDDEQLSRTYKNKTTYTYDSSGNVSTIIYYNIDENTGDESLDSEGRIISRDANSNITKYEYWAILDKNEKQTLTKLTTTTVLYDTKLNFFTANYSAAYKKIQIYELLQNNYPRKMIYTDASAEEFSQTTFYTYKFVDEKATKVTETVRWHFNSYTNSFSIEYCEL